MRDQLLRATDASQEFPALLLHLGQGDPPNFAQELERGHDLVDEAAEEASEAREEGLPKFAVVEYLVRRCPSLGSYATLN